MCSFFSSAQGANLHQALPEALQGANGHQALLQPTTLQFSTAPPDGDPKGEPVKPPSDGEWSPIHLQPHQSSLYLVQVSLTPPQP